MIQVLMYQGKWRIRIVDEEWEFEDNKRLEMILSQILSMKSKWGRLKCGRR